MVIKNSDVKESTENKKELSQAEQSLSIRERINLLFDDKEDDSLNEDGLEEEYLQKAFGEMESGEFTLQTECLKRMPKDERMVYYTAIENEPMITDDVVKISNKNGGSLAGLENRIKKPSSLYNKTNERGNEIENVSDIVRYTDIYSASELAEKAMQGLDDFKHSGYSIDKVKNTWNNNAVYKGVNVQMTSPNGQKFEIQYHTQESFDLKNGQLHKLYNERRNLSDESPRAIQLDKTMRDMSAKLVKPKNIEEIKNK